MTTGWPPYLLQDDSRKLSDWFASRVDARWTVRQVCAEIERKRMTTTPLPPAIEPVAWFEYARKKPTLKRLVFDRTSRSQLRVAGWVSEPLIKESDAQQARADLEAEVQRLRDALARIESWSSHTSEFAIDYGSNGVRDYYRGIASTALKEQP